VPIKPHHNENNYLKGININQKMTQSSVFTSHHSYNITHLQCRIKAERTGLLLAPHDILINAESIATRSKTGAQQQSASGKKIECIMAARSVRRLTHIKHHMRRTNCCALQGGEHDGLTCCI
jgi:hypothetical protein